MLALFVTKESLMSNIVYIHNGNDQYHDLFANAGFEITNKLKLATLVCFTGGEDVSPAIYGDKAHPFTGNNPFRDEEEAHVFSHCVEHRIAMVGICRGAQFLNVMSGGRMYQHVEGHTRSHNIVDLETGEVVYVSSTHHQMMLPGENGAIIATSVDVTGERQWYDGQVFMKDVTNEGVEVVYYPTTNCLCFQPHPEFSGVEFEGMKNYFFSLCERFLKVQAGVVA
jgi:gamma-glutamyl-gamma-aminobutyrate hydrolase PuuD